AANRNGDRARDLRQRYERVSHGGPLPGGRRVCVADRVARRARGSGAAASDRHCRAQSSGDRQSHECLRANRPEIGNHLMNGKPKILVTGGNGFIGSRVVRELLERGYAVRCLLRTTSDTTRIDELDIERVYGDVRDRASVKASVEDVAGCIHLAAVVAWSLMRSPVLEETIVEGTRNVLDAIAPNPDVRLVYVSSAIAINASHEPHIFDESSAFELLETPLLYAIAKHKAERLV